MAHGVVDQYFVVDNQPISAVASYVTVIRRYYNTQ